MIKYPRINIRSQLRIWLNKHEYEFISNEQLTLLEECEFCEVRIDECHSSFCRHCFNVYVTFKKNGDTQDRWSGVYLFHIRKDDLQ
ncbi:hypothetical protein B5E92_00850 [Erysipelatoclostridium sp. An15]|uniref:hypothetical protein n=1 Tax=Erysipelatoclostridium sp. An15 TaxID=1965566 RepID=UPI000B36D9E5|nr:hypothetical protein [Erysipelatoclostridium sp. An15]OUQ09352.1 hypothetical protein B5E92_00850 [Erysipelatoclostridium sp. An15]